MELSQIIAFPLKMPLLFQISGNVSVPGFLNFMWTTDGCRKCTSFVWLNGSKSRNIFAPTVSLNRAAYSLGTSRWMWHDPSSEHQTWREVSARPAPPLAVLQTEALAWGGFSVGIIGAPPSWPYTPGTGLQKQIKLVLSACQVLWSLFSVILLVEVWSERF